jgi:hypothetical protein
VSQYESGGWAGGGASVEGEIILKVKRGSYRADQANGADKDATGPGYRMAVGGARFWSSEIRGTFEPVEILG